MKTLTFSSSFYIEEEEKETKTDKLFDKIFKDKAQEYINGDYDGNFYYHGSCYFYGTSLFSVFIV